MPDLYTSPEHTIPEWNATITGGITLVIHTPAEVEGLELLCKLAGQPPANRWQAIIDQLKAAGTNLKAWYQYRDRVALLRAVDRPSPDSSKEKEPPTPEEALEGEEIETLIMLLDYVRTLWEHENQLPGPGVLALAVTLADPTISDYPRITITAQRPAVAFHLGSRLKNTILTGLETATNFVVAFFDRRKSDARIEAAFRDVRARRLEAGRVFNLLTVDEVLQNRQALANKNALIICVHGLMSIDVGTFDSLLEAVQQYESLGSRVALAGFPHNTLDSIEQNAHILYEHFRTIVNREDLKSNGYLIACIAHSRGGLVVRRAAAKFYADANLDTDQRRRLKGCITFGTPHRGVLLAKEEKELVAQVLHLMTWQQTGGRLGVRDFLAYFERHGNFQGVADMQPQRIPEDGKLGNFIFNLREAEKRNAEGELSAIPLLAIGGNMRGETPNDHLLKRLIHWTARYLIGHGNHDWVVEEDSSLPSDLPENSRRRVVCNHFGYFHADSREMHNEAADWLHDLLFTAVVKEMGTSEKLAKPVNSEQNLQQPIPPTRGTLGFVRTPEPPLPKKPLPLPGLRKPKPEKT